MPALTLLLSDCSRSVASSWYCPPRRREEQQAELGAYVIVGDVLAPQLWEHELSSMDALVM